MTKQVRRAQPDTRLSLCCMVTSQDDVLWVEVLEDQLLRTGAATADCGNGASDTRRIQCVALTSSLTGPLPRRIGQCGVGGLWKACFRALFSVW